MDHYQILGDDDDDDDLDLDDLGDEDFDDIDNLDDLLGIEEVEDEIVSPGVQAEVSIDLDYDDPHAIVELELHDPNDGEGLTDEEEYLDQITQAHRKAKARTTAQSGRGGANDHSRKLAGSSQRGLNHLKRDLTYANYGELLYEEFKQKKNSKERSESNEQQLDEQSDHQDVQPPVHKWATSTNRSKNSIDVRSQAATEKRERKIAALRDKIDAENGMTFQPQINKVSSGHRRGDLLQEMKARERRRQQKLLALQEAVLAHEEASFTPQINAFSQSLVRNEPVHERLFKLQREKEMQLALNQVEASAALKVDPETGQKMFQPQINVGIDQREECVEDALYRDAENRRMRREMVIEQTELQDKMVRAAHKMTSYSKKLVQAKTERELLQTFQELDIDDRGWLNYQQVATAVKRLGLFGQSGRHHRNSHEKSILQKVWSAMDVEQTGAVSCDNFVMFLAHVMRLDRSSNTDVPEHMQRVARELGSITATKLSYTQIGHTKADSSATEAELQCTFTPQINEKSDGMDKEARVNIKASDRYEVLYQKAKVTEMKKKKLLIEQQDREMEGCAFKPKINRKSAKMVADRGKDAKSHFDYLYKGATKKDRQKKPPVKSSLELELEEHCTFKPKVERPTKKSGTVPKSGKKKAKQQLPRGYEDSINRVRAANEDKEMLRQEEERFYCTKDYEANRERFQAVKPFNFALDTRTERPAPLLVMEVNLGVAKSGRIGIYEGDEPAVLAHNFATTYQLDDDMCLRLESLIIDQLTAMGNAPAAHTQMGTYGARSASPGSPGSRRDQNSPQGGEGYSESDDDDSSRYNEESPSGTELSEDAEHHARAKLRQRQQRIISSRRAPTHAELFENDDDQYMDSEED